MDSSRFGQCSPTAKPFIPKLLRFNPDQAKDPSFFGYPSTESDFMSVHIEEGAAYCASPHSIRPPPVSPPVSGSEKTYNSSMSVPSISSWPLHPPISVRSNNFEAAPSNDRFKNRTPICSEFLHPNSVEKNQKFRNGVVKWWKCTGDNRENYESRQGKRNTGGGKPRKTWNFSNSQTDNSPPLLSLYFCDNLTEIESHFECFKADKKKRFRHVSTQLTSFKESKTVSSPSYSDILSGKKKPLVLPDPPTEKPAGIPGQSLIRDKAEALHKAEELEQIKSENIEEVVGAPGLITAKEVLNALAAERLEQKVNKKKKNKPTKQLNLVDFVSITSQKPKPSKAAQKENAVPENVHASSAKKQEKIKPVSLPRGNVLDSSAPVVHKGKTRENPKQKLTTTRKIILREKEAKKLVNNGNEEEKLAEIVDTNAERNAEEPSATINIAPIPNNPPHSKKFREYCKNTATTELNSAVIAFLQELARFQDKMHAKDPAKAKLKKRMVCGLREVKKFAQVEKIKCIVVAPDIDSVSSAGGLNDQLGTILSLCEEQNVPIIFSLRKHKLGRTIYKKSPVSCVGILNYQGAEQFFRVVKEELEKAEEDYAAKSAKIKSHTATTVNEHCEFPKDTDFDETVKTSDSSSGKNE